MLSNQNCISPVITVNKSENQKKKVQINPYNQYSLTNNSKLMFNTQKNRRASAVGNWTMSSEGTFFSMTKATTMNTTQNGFNVLIIDDEPSYKDIYKRMLNKFSVKNLSISYYPDGINVVELFLSRELSSFDLIIMDNNMNNMNGTDVINLILWMKNNGIASNYYQSEYTILSRIYISSAEVNPDIIKEKLDEQNCVEITGKQVEKAEMEKILRKLGGVK